MECLLKVPKTFTIVDLLKGHGTDLSNEEVGMLSRAAHVAVWHHKSQFRLTGEPYWEHTFSVSEGIRQLGYGAEEQCAARMHDVIEDCDLLDRPRIEEEIRKYFPSRVIWLVLALTKTEGVDYLDQLQRTGLQDPSVISIKTVDRLHNLLTIRGFGIERQLKYLEETRDDLLRIFRVVRKGTLDPDAVLKMEVAYQKLRSTMNNGFYRVRRELRNR